MGKGVTGQNPESPTQVPKAPIEVSMGKGSTVSRKEVPAAAWGGWAIGASREGPGWLPAVRWETPGQPHPEDPGALSLQLAPESHAEPRC